MSIFNRISPQALRLVALLAVMLLVVTFFSSQIEGYLGGRLFNRISSSVAIVALIATGQTLVMLTRNIDLSVGAVLGFSAFLTGSLVSAHPDMHPVLLVFFSVLVGAGFGILNGLLVAYARVPSIIVTLATMAIFRSLLVEYSDAKSITTESLPEWLTNFPNLPIFRIGTMEFRAAFVASVLVVLVVHFALTRLRSARQLFAVGSNPDAAGMAGIPVQRVVLVAFVLSGMLAGLAGFMFLARFGNITVVAGLGFELNSVAAAVVGGVNIFGGSGSVIGALLGAILVDLLQTSLIRWAVISEFWQEAVLGALIMLSVTADTLLSRKLTAARAARTHEKAQRAKRELNQ